MKKTAALMILCILLLAAFAGFAESEPTQSVDVYGKFTITCTVPEGYEYTEIQNADNVMLAALMPADESKPFILFSVARSDEYSGRTLNDFTEEELAIQIEIATEDMDEPDVSIRETAYGTKLIVARELNNVNSVADITTVYKGYFITFLLAAQEDSVLTDEQVETAIDFISELWIIESDDAPGSSQGE